MSSTSSKPEPEKQQHHYSYKLSELQKLRKKETNKIWRLSHKEWIIEYSRRYYQQHREQVLERTREYHRIKYLEAKVLREISEISSSNRAKSSSISKSTMEVSA